MSVSGFEMGPGTILENHDRKRTYSLKVPTYRKCSTIFNAIEFNFRHSVEV